MSPLNHWESIILDKLPLAPLLPSLSVKRPELAGHSLLAQESPIQLRGQHLLPSGGSTQRPEGSQLPITSSQGLLALVTN